MIVNEWLLFNTGWTIFQLYQDESQIHFDKMMVMMMFALCYTNTFSWIFIMLAHGSNSPLVDNIAPVGYIFLVPSQSVSNSLMLQWRSSKYTFSGLLFDLTETRTHYLPHSRWAHLTITPPMLFLLFDLTETRTHYLPHSRWAHLTITPSMLFLLFDLTETRTHYLPHSRWAHLTITPSMLFLLFDLTEIRTQDLPHSRQTG